MSPRRKSPLLVFEHQEMLGVRGVIARDHRGELHRPVDRVRCRGAGEHVRGRDEAVRRHRLGADHTDAHGGIVGGVHAAHHHPARRGRLQSLGGPLSRPPEADHQLALRLVETSTIGAHRIAHDHRVREAGEVLGAGVVPHHPVARAGEPPDARLEGVALGGPTLRADIDAPRVLVEIGGEISPGAALARTQPHEDPIEGRL